MMYYMQALALYPKSAVNDLGPIYNQIGMLYAENDQWGDARRCFEQSIQYKETCGDRHGAGKVRHNLAIMHVRALNDLWLASGKREYLVRAQDYAQAALRDFQHYRGCTADDESLVNNLLEVIARKLHELAN